MQMALFPKKDLDAPFDRQSVIDEIIGTIKSTYPDYHIIQGQEGDLWDLLIIRSVSRTIKEIIGAFNHEKISDQKIQQIYAVCVSNQPPEEDNLDLIKKIGTWVTQYMRTDNVASIIRRLNAHNC